jgi:hypothetical protein
VALKQYQAVSKEKKINIHSFRILNKYDLLFVNLFTGFILVAYTVNSDWQHSMIITSHIN